VKTFTIIALALLLVSPAVAAEGEQEKAQAKEGDEIFDVLEEKKESAEESDSLSNAIDKLDGALEKSRTGELESVKSNLEYNKERLGKLQKQAEAKREYLDTFWETVAVYFDNLKEKYDGETSSTEYRKAVISLREEYEQREAEARRELDRLEEEIASAQERIDSLSQRLKLAELDAELRSTDLGAEAQDAQKPPTPSRADEAIEVMEELSLRKRQRRVGELVKGVTLRPVAALCWESLANELTEGR